MTATLATEAEIIAEYQATYSDLYKDAYGFRPRGSMPQWTVAEWEQEFQRLAVICDDNREAESKAHAAAAAEVEATIAQLIVKGAADRAAALRWLHDANTTNGDNEYLCYCLGLPYGYFRE